MLILTGSAAIRHWFPDFPREPKDVDYFGEGKNVPGKIEYLKCPPVLKTCCFPDDICTPNVLYTLKASHLFWDIKWDKHMWDFQWLKKKGCVFYPKLFRDLYEFWNELHGKNHRSDLDMTAEDFFDNALPKTYDHDKLHLLINPQPAYKKILKGEVAVCMEKFAALSFEEKCDVVTEEVMVMAWERYRKMDYRAAYEKMLKKFIRNHAPMEEALFIIENYIHLLKPKFNYYIRIEEGLCYDV